MKISTGNLIGVIKSGRFLGGASGLLVIVLLFAGCGTFLRLGRNVEQLEKDLFLRGRVVTAPNQTGRVVVVVLAPNGDESVGVADVAVLADNEMIFGFSLPPKEGYRLGAFCDENGDERYQENEPVWLSDKLRSQDFKAAAHAPVLEVTLKRGVPIAQDLLVRLRGARAGRTLAELAGGHQIRTFFGLVQDFDAPRFTPEAAHLGLWEPLTFLNRYGVGVFFLEPYDPSRIPVLLVHGAGGSPGDWKEFVPMLDKTKYQVWLYSYPSGLRIGQSARILQTEVQGLYERYGFKRLDVIAHSMGGLVSRKFVLDASDAGNAAYLGKYITLSTPWAGHEAAGLGVRHGPEVIPCWLDLQPGSDFQAQLFKRNLPDSVAHYLGFSFCGSSVIVLPESNDGVVSIASELAPGAQRQARAIHGFNETHNTILASREAAEWVGRILEALPEKPK